MSELEQALSRLQAEVLGLRSVLDQVGAYIFIKDLQGCYTYVNTLVCQLFGHPAEAILGRDDSHFFDLELSNQLRLNDQRVLQYGETLEREELNVIRPSGEVRIYWTVKAPVRDAQGGIVGMCGISTDITERKRLEQALEQKQQLLDAVLNNVDANVYMKSQDRRFLYVNSRTAELFGLPGEAIVGRRDDQVLPKEAADRFWEMDRRVFAEGCRQAAEETFVNADGEQRHYWSVKVPIELPDAEQALIGFSTDITELHLLKQELQRQAYIDPLTGMNNRRFFFNEAEKEFQRSLRYQQAMAVMLVDIDHFKRVNDSHGHAVGDQVLIALARHCQQNVRECDLLGRLGGEEFVILLPITDLAAAQVLAERLCRSLECLQVPTAVGVLRLTVSIGVAERSSADGDFAALLERADKAMYQAKRAGRNRVAVAG